MKKQQEKVQEVISVLDGLKCEVIIRMDDGIYNVKQCGKPAIATINYHAPFPCCKSCLPAYEKSFTEITYLEE